MKRDSSGKNTTLTTEEFIKSLPESFVEKFNYSITEYSGTRDFIEYTCLLHGKQSMRAGKHKGSKFGCNSCAKDYSNECKKVKGYKSFLDKGKETHGDWYDYSKVDYMNSSEKVIIICPEHGEFLQTPNSHRKSGCMGCGRLLTENALTYDHDTLLQKCKDKFGDKFTYDFTGYKNSTSKVKIIYPEHGVFKNTVSQHISSDYGCTSCSSIHRKTNRISKEDHLTFLYELFPEGYHFFEEDVNTSKDLVRVYCKEHDNLSSHRLTHIKRGTVCIKCAKRGRGFYTETLLEKCKDYFLKDNNNIYFIHFEGDKYKIGLAKVCKNRHDTIGRKGNFSITKIVTKPLNTYEAFYLENRILSEYKNNYFEYSSKFSGYTEVLQLNKQSVINIKNIIDNYEEKTSNEWKESTICTCKP